MFCELPTLVPGSVVHQLPSLTFAKRLSFNPRVCVSVKSEAGATKQKNLSDEINLSVDCCGRVLMAVMPIKAIPLSKSNMQQGL